MPFIEAPTTFYMGRRYDADAHKLDDEVVYYDSRDLTTHAVVVGMTGSGKTGLCITLLEEAVLDNIPAIVIDPKGDITNLLLTFPELRPEDFAPWINMDDTRRAGMEPAEYAQDVAQQWRDGLSSWGIVPSRIAAMKRAAQFSIYTPGSDAGLPISILDSLQAPREGWAGYEEVHRERISGIVTALLALIGINVEPVRDREHVLVANIFENAWKQGKNLTLEDIILQVQNPPFNKLGVFDVNTFFPEKDRFKLAMSLNKIIASPSFQSWMQGEPLDVRSLLYTPEGRPRVSVFYVAHLNDAERAFMITLLLENMLSWMRSLSGTTSLRAILYFDEMFGFFPPAPHNPPTKEPLLRLLKQARAFGIGLILATQNPGDLDYKGLSNAGTWFIGKLQTDNDKARVLNGLQSTATAQTPVDTKTLGALLSNLDPRVFMLHNVHDNTGPILMHSRWSMSYLRGPLTRQQIRQLMESQRQALSLSPTPSSVSSVRQSFTPTPAMPAMPAPGIAAMPIVFPPAASSPLFSEPPVPRSATPPPGFLPESPYPASSSPVSDPNGRSFGSAILSGAAGAPLNTAAPTNTPLPSVSAAPRNSAVPEGFSEKAISLPAATAQYFLPTSTNIQQAVRDWERKYSTPATSVGTAQLLYHPTLLAQVMVRYLDRKTSVEQDQLLAFQVPNLDQSGIVHWHEFMIDALDHTLVTGDPQEQAYYGTPAPGLTDAKRLAALKSDLIDYIFRSASLSVQHNADLDLYAQSNESQRDFTIRLQAAAREARDAEIDKTTQKYDKELQKLDEKIRRETRDQSYNQKSADELKREDMYTTGEAMMRMFRGRPTNTLSRMSRVRLYKNQAQERSRASEQAITDIEHDIELKQGELRKALQAINDKWAKTASTVEDVKVTPYKKDIALQLFGIGWTPLWHVPINSQWVMLPAYPITNSAAAKS